MSWFFFAALSLAGWGFADLFYKTGSDENDRYSHLKIAVWVGLMLGLCALIMVPFAENAMTPSQLLRNAVAYLPASLSYIISMIIGYAGLRYLELSIISPVQNASGALSILCMILFFIFTGNGDNVAEIYNPLNIAGTATVILGVVGIAIVEKKEAQREAAGPAGELHGSGEGKAALYESREGKAELHGSGEGDRRYRMGALALLFPILYCVFDTIGTAADGVILDENTGLGLGEIDVIILYGLTFFLVGLICWFVLWIKEKKVYNPFTSHELPKAAAAGCEAAGQVFYVYAMAANPLLSAPMIASYCVLSVALSRIFLKEKLAQTQYGCVGLVIVGILLFGIAEGLSA